ncbi:MAG: PEP-CTERM sorting domain-containing protein [Fuerstiella sp.]
MLPKQVRPRTIQLLLLTLTLSATPAHAGLIKLDESQFNAAAGGTAVVEDFEAFGTGSYASPFVFANGRYQSSVGNSAPVRILDQATWGPTRRLLSGAITDVRTFDLFAAGTTLVGMDVFYINPDNVFDVTVVGGSGMLNLSGQTGTSLGTFLGFQDALGITSIQFRNVTPFAPSNYSFDNVRTASIASVPEPSSLTLLAMGAITIFGCGRRRRRIERVS